ncbi:MAG TPA: alpha/beta hydrolase [Treponema sp.]|nr:alpha/beta hydrolase [Treponema sp.]
MTTNIERLTMSDGNENAVRSWIPNGDVKAVVVLSHGMAEHSARYDRFGCVLAENGIALYAEDHRGHGETAKIAKEKGTGTFGYLAPKNGFFRVVEDIHEEVEEVKKRHPGKKVILFGHSFGSFVAQCFIETYGSSIDACVLCGSAGPRLSLMKSAKVIGGIIKTFSNPKKPSKFLDKLAFGSYNKKYANPRTSFDWLSRDTVEVDKYIMDDWCGFICTTSFFCDMFEGLCYIHTKEHMAQIPQNLPVHIIAGEADPVSDYGKTLKDLLACYQANGMTKVDLKLWPECRHELLNEVNREEIEQDILSFIQGIVSA